MKKIQLPNIINVILSLYILSIYIFTYRENLNVISNALALLFIAGVWSNFLLTKAKLKFNKFMVIHIVFLGICMCSSLYAIDPNIAISKIRTIILISIIMISLINYIDTYVKIIKVIKYFVFSGFIASIYILSESDFSEISRFGETLGNVNAIGMIIGISTIFCVYIILSEKRYIYIVLVVVMIPTILITGSRKALIFILINIIFILYFKNKSGIMGKVKFILTSALCVAVALYIIFEVPLFYEIIGLRIENLVNFVFNGGTNEGSINIRAYMVQFGVNVFREKPFQGYGIDNYRVLFGGIYSHNNFIELMVGIGLFGTVIYYLTQILVIIDLYKSAINNKHALLCYVFIGIFVSYIALSTSLVFYDSKHFCFLIAVGSVIRSIFKFQKLSIHGGVGNVI